VYVFCRISPDLENSDFSLNRTVRFLSGRVNRRKNRKENRRDKGKREVGTVLAGIFTPNASYDCLFTLWFVKSTILLFITTAYHMLPDFNLILQFLTMETSRRYM